MAKNKKGIVNRFTSIYVKKGNTVYVDVDGQKAIKSAFFNKTSTKKRQQKVFVDDNENDSVDGDSEEKEEVLFLRSLVSEIQSEKKELHKLLDQQQRLALQDKKLLEEYKEEIKELKSLTNQSASANLFKDVDEPKDIEIDKKKRRWWPFGK